MPKKLQIFSAGMNTPFWFAFPPILANCQGNSLGGGVGLTVAGIFPNSIKSVISIDYPSPPFVETSNTLGISVNEPVG